MELRNPRELISQTSLATKFLFLESELSRSFSEEWDWQNFSLSLEEETGDDAMCFHFTCLRIHFFYYRKLWFAPREGGVCFFSIGREAVQRGGAAVQFLSLYFQTSSIEKICVLLSKKQIFAAYSA